MVHFPSAWFALGNVPSVYNPHDLQHLAYPQNFTQDDLTLREVLMPAGCRFAHTMSSGHSGSRTTSSSLSSRRGQDPDHPVGVADSVLPRAERGGSREGEEKYGIEGPVALYPAATYPYKNHLRVLEALAYLRDTKGVVLRLVCTGAVVESFWPRIEARVRGSI